MPSPASDFSLTPLTLHKRRFARGVTDRVALSTEWSRVAKMEGRDWGETAQGQTHAAFGQWPLWPLHRTKGILSVASQRMRSESAVCQLGCYNTCMGLAEKHSSNHASTSLKALLDLILPYILPTEKAAPGGLIILGRMCLFSLSMNWTGNI